MASLSLAEAAKIQQNPLIRGIIQSIVTVNQMYRVWPFQPIQGNALLYTRELAIGGVAPIGIGGGSNTIPAGAKTPATFLPVTTALKALIGDALVDHFVETTMSNTNSQKGTQISSKAKGLGREYQRQMILGDSSTNALEFDGLQKLVPAGQIIDGASAVFDFGMLDAAISKVIAKDGQVDFFMMPDVVIRQYYKALRAAGGASIGDIVTLPSGEQVPGYRGVPLFRNDWIPITGTTTQVTDIYAGCLDDGSQKTGIAGLTSSVQNGIFVTNVGESETTNDTITRLRLYASLAVFSELGIARIQNVKVN